MIGAVCMLESEAPPRGLQRRSVRDQGSRAVGDGADQAATQQRPTGRRREEASGQDRAAHREAKALRATWIDTCRLYDASLTSIRDPTN